MSFNVNNINFSNGVYDSTSKTKLNGAEVAFLQSYENLNIVLKDFEAAIAAGLNPNDVKEEIFKKRNLKDSDFTTYHTNILVRKVEAMYRAHN